MPDVLLSSQALLERLGEEERDLKGLGLHAQAAGVRSAIVILLREAEAAKSTAPPAAGPSSPT